MIISDTLKRVGLGLAAAVLLFGGGYASGRFVAPDKVVEKERVVEKQVVVEKVDEKKLEQLSEQIKQTLNQLAQLKKSIHKEKTSTTFPDGRVEAKETVDINIEKTVQTTEVKEVIKEVVVVQEKIVDRVVTQVKEVDKIVTKESDRPENRIGVMVGGSLTPPLLPLAGPLVVGVQAQRRLIGPLSVELWGLSSGQVGTGLSVEF